MNLIEAMDQHPGNLREDCEFLRLELMPCIAGLRALFDQLGRLSFDEIRRRVEGSMAHQQAILDRCAEVISQDSPLEEQVKALRDAQRKLLRKLVERFHLGRPVDGGSTSRRCPLPMCN